jgi:hypothetical protein
MQSGNARVNAACPRAPRCVPAAPPPPRAPCAGACGEFIRSSPCEGIEPGEGAVAECLSQLIAASEASDSEDAGACAPAMAGTQAMAPRRRTVTSAHAALAARAQGWTARGALGVPSTAPLPPARSCRA